MHNEIKVIAPPGYRAVQNDDGTVTFVEELPYVAPHAAIGSNPRVFWRYETWRWDTSAGREAWLPNETSSDHRPTEGPTIRNVRRAIALYVTFEGSDPDEVQAAVDDFRGFNNI